MTFRISRDQITKRVLWYANCQNTVHERQIDLRERSENVRWKRHLNGNLFPQIGTTIAAVSGESLVSALQLPEWGQVFIPDASLVESFVRASAVYLSLVVMFRLVLNRQGGAIGLPDVMLVVLVSECVSASISADAKSVPNGLSAVFALLFWNYLLDLLAYRWSWLRRLLEPEPSLIVQDGQPVRKNLERERISDDELAAQLREQGIDDVKNVKVAFIEAEGTVSVIPKERSGVREALRIEAQRVPASTPDFDRAGQLFLAAIAEYRAAVDWHEKKRMGKDT